MRATFAAADAIVVAAGVLGGGVRPLGAELPWIARLLTLGVATPVLAMSAVGAATAAIWLRYRAPVGDRNALGLLGRPPVAIATAAALVIAGAVGETFLDVGWWLLTVVALDLVGLALLRRALHLGLVEEAAELAIGPPITCANCGASTARHTFCGNCGIALKALPKARGGAPGEAGGRLHRPGHRLQPHRHWLVAFVAGALVVAAAAVLVAVLAAPASRQAVCRPGVPCGVPPALPRARRRTAGATFPGYAVWQSSALGFSLRFDTQFWSIAQQSSAGVELQTPDGSGVLVVDGAPQSQATPQTLLNGEASTISGQMLGFTSDTNPADQLLGPAVGLRPGVGAVFDAAISDPQAPQSPVVGRAGERERRQCQHLRDRDRAGQRPGVRGRRRPGGRRCHRLDPVGGFVIRRRPRVRRSAALALAVVLAGGGATALALGSWRSAPAPAVRDLGRLAASRRLDFTLDLVLPGERALTASLTAISDPRSPQYRDYISAQQFGERYGISSRSLARLERRLAEAGVRVIESYPQRTALRVRASVAAIGRLFRVAIGRFADRAGERWHAPFSPPVIPPALRHVISDVSGLSTRPVWHPEDVPSGGLAPPDTGIAYDIAPLARMHILGQGQSVGDRRSLGLRPQRPRELRAVPSA